MQNWTVQLTCQTEIQTQTADISPKHHQIHCHFSVVLPIRRDDAILRLAFYCTWDSRSHRNELWKDRRSRSNATAVFTRQRGFLFLYCPHGLHLFVDRSCWRRSTITVLRLYCHRGGDYIHSSRVDERNTDSRKKAAKCLLKTQ